MVCIQHVLEPNRTECTKSHTLLTPLRGNAFCKLYCDVSSQAFVTHGAKISPTMVWNEEFHMYAFSAFGVWWVDSLLTQFSYIGALQPTQELYIKVYSSNQEFLGHVRFRLGALCNAPGNETGGWYTLEKEPKTSTPKQPAQLYLRLNYPKGEDPCSGRIRTEDPTKFYTFKEELGAGAFGIVRLCVSKVWTLWISPNRLG